MWRPGHSLSLAVLLCSSALGQQDLRSHLIPITAPLREVHVRLDPSTGRAVRTSSQLGTILAPIYNNTCFTGGYYIGLNSAAATGGSQAEAVVDQGRLPSSTSPQSSICNPGSADSYGITQLQISYCTTTGSPVAYVSNLWNQNGSSCPNVFGMSPDASITLIGLPGSQSPGTLACYTVTIDLGTPGFQVLAGSGNTTSNRFAFSHQMPGTTGLDGPLIAGNPSIGGCAPCVGTAWERPSRTSNPGTGLGATDSFWLETFGGAGTGCYAFSAQPFASFSLRLDGQVDEPPIKGEDCGMRPDIYTFSAAERADLFAVMSDYITREVVLEHLLPPNDKHGSSRFLPWHRKYIKGMEDYLISRGRPQFVPLPSWAPSTPIPGQFLLNGGVDPDCPTDVFTSHNCAHLLNSAPGIPLPATLSSGLCFHLFYFPIAFLGPGLRRTLENYHNPVHVAIGGVMGNFKSPAAPIFWLWHAFVDDVWIRWQCECDHDEGPAFNSYTAAERNTDLVAGVADAWMQDSAEDIAMEPNTQSGHILWESRDIWVRNTRATAVGSRRFLNEHEHQNPEYATTPTELPYIYAKIRNRGCEAISGQVHLYWANASSGLMWPTHFTEVATSPVAITDLCAGQEHVAEFHWLDIPEPTPATGDHFCLLARFVASPASIDPINGEGSGVVITGNVRNSNQIAWKNLTIVDDVANKTLLLRNVSTTGTLLSLVFTVPEDQIGDSYFTRGPVVIDLGTPLFMQWVSNGSLGTGIAPGPGATELVILGNGSTVDGLPLGFDQEQLISMRFGPVLSGSEPCEHERTVFDVQLSAFEAATVLGGNTYEIRLDEVLPSPEVLIAALEPQVNCAAGSVALQVTSGLPSGATLQWHVDDTPIPSATAGSHAATQSGQYRVLITYANGCSRFSEPIDVHIATPPPNDAPCAAIYLGLGGMAEYDIYCATSQSGEVSPGAGSGQFAGCQSVDGWCSSDTSVQNSVWYYFTAPATGTVTIHVDGSHEVDHDHMTNTQLAVWQVGDCADFGTYTLVAANDDSGDHGVFGTAPAFHELTGLTPGVDYFIQIDGYLGSLGSGTLHVEPVLGHGFCDASDGSHAHCPCGGGAPNAGCEIAQGTGGVHARVTDLGFGPNSAQITATGYPPTASPTAIVIRANNIEGTPIQFGDGLRCVGTVGFTRLAATTASGGASVHNFSHNVGAGAFNYQVWFRNTPASYCVTTGPSGGAFNLSNGVTIVWP